MHTTYIRSLMLALLCTFLPSTTVNLQWHYEDNGQVLCLEGHTITAIEKYAKSLLILTTITPQNTTKKYWFDGSISFIEEYPYGVMLYPYPIDKGSQKTQSKITKKKKTNRVCFYKRTRNKETGVITLSLRITTQKPPTTIHFKLPEKFTQQKKAPLSYICNQQSGYYGFTLPQDKNPTACTLYLFDTDGSPLQQIDNYVPGTHHNNTITVYAKNNYLGLFAFAKKKFSLDRYISYHASAQLSPTRFALQQKKKFLIVAAKTVKPLYEKDGYFIKNMPNKNQILATNVHKTDLILYNRSTGKVKKTLPMTITNLLDEKKKSYDSVKTDKQQYRTTVITDENGDTIYAVSKDGALYMFNLITKSKKKK